MNTQHTALLRQINFILALSFAILSCGSDKKVEPVTNQETPQVLDDTKTDLNVNSLKRLYGDDIIQKLFDEALERDTKLKLLMAEIEAVNEIRSDSLKAYDKYINNNANYWSQVKQYAQQINDSIAKKEALLLFEMLEKKYTKRISKLATLRDSLTNKEDELDDQIILMKLMVTGNMMNNYQSNELPESKTLSSLHILYDSTLGKTQLYSKIKK